MHFYESKRNIFWIMVLCVGILIFFGFLSYLTFLEEDYVYTLFFFLFTLLMVWVLNSTQKKWRSQNPYVTTSPSYLTLYVKPDEAIDIRWEDIVGYSFYEIKGTPFIGLALTDEEKYVKQLSPGTQRLIGLSAKLGYPKLNITFRHITEKEKMLEELDRHTPNVSMEHKG
jgi:hypothetical protein